MSVAPGCCEENSDSREFFLYRAVETVPERAYASGLVVQFLKGRWQNAIIGSDYGNQGYRE